MSLKRWFCLGMGVVVGSYLWADTVDYEWEGAIETSPGSGIYDWDQDGNWDLSGFPSVGGVEGDRALFTDVFTGGRTVVTPGVSTEIHSMVFNYTDGSTGVFTLQLGNDLGFTHTGGNPLSFVNDSNNASNLVIDLDGNTLEFLNGWVTASTSPAITISSTTPGGVVRVAGGTTDIGFNFHLGAGVTLEKSSGTINLREDADPDSLIRYIGLSGTSSIRFRSDIGSFVFGDATTNNVMTIDTNSSVGSFQVARDFTLLAGTGDANRSLGWRGVGTMSIGRDYRDLANTNNDHAITHAGTRSANQWIVFNGGLDNDVGEVESVRTGNTINYAVGSATVAGNVRLVRDLYTNLRYTGGLLETTAGDDPVGGNFLIRLNSRLDLNEHSVHAAFFEMDAYTDLEDLPTLAITLNGTDHGRFNLLSGPVDTSEPEGDRVGGEIVLGRFVLDVTHLGGWENGENLVLFTYDGSFSFDTGLYGTDMNALLVLGDVPIGFTYGDFVDEDGELRLTNVVIPEPLTAAALAMGLVFVALRFRRRLVNR